ncbi:MAG: dinitrogenase iron-molybdenum cofactor biosynthesis protein [Elusimicrobia bacterium]|nr:dinitrogenase iron-molybdenum cofactor biosynthesis protein [Elusimicrobiota bacterium]
MKKIRLAVTLTDDRGMDSEVSAHFGQCGYFLIVDIENEKIKSSQVVANTAQHGGGGCQAVSEILKYRVSHVVAGGMGPNAINKFAAANVPVFTYCGKASAAVKEFLESSLGNIDPCKDHDHHGSCQH